MQGTLTFTRPDHVVPDEERPGLLRALHSVDDEAGDAHTCELHDLTDPDVAEPGLLAAGFETIDLSGNTALQTALDEVRRLDHLSDDADAAIRESLSGTSFSLADGRTLRIDLVVDDGLFHRRSGPNGLDVNPGGIDGINGHGGALFVHGDQDVFGTPLRQLMHGAAPEMFNHVTPDGRNDEATTFLLNLWIPLHAPVQPLALMDRRTLDAPRHQLRYGLPVDGFLERDEDATVNDIWNFLHDDDQRWYIRTDMTSMRGYVFDTLGTPHGAAVLAGEPTLASHMRTLRAVLGLLVTGDEEGARAAATTHAAPALPTGTPATIADAARTMTDLIAEATAAAADANWTDWTARADAAIDRVIRRSIELRLVASVAAE
jgi:hypothetical protein